MSETKSSEAGQPHLSIVVPVYNEEENISLLNQRIHDACEPLSQPYEIVFVDDGSRDGTFNALTAIHEQDSRVKVVRFRKNYGQTAAMAAGFEYARGETIISMDGDLQNDPADIPRLLTKLEEGYDVVCGWRKNRQDKLISRRFPSIIANWIIGRVTGVRIHDNGCSLKAYRASMIKNVALYGEAHRFIPAMSTLTGARISEIVVNHHARRFGQSKYGIGRVWRVMLDIITVKMLAGFAARPALWFGILSLPFIIGGLFALSWASLQFLGIRSDKWIATSTTAFLSLFLGGHLLSLAIIGELLLKTGDYSPKRTLDPTIKEL
jgi:glycosyltransferase involved in cell wall biosynthesis